MPAETKVVAVATDGSAGASLAVEGAATFARSLYAELLAIRVVLPPQTPENGAEPEPGNGGAPEVEREHRRLREALEKSLPNEGLRARAVVESGEDIAAVILDAARRGDA